MRSLRRRNTHTRKAISLQGNSEGSYKKWALEDGSEGAVFGQGKPADQCWTLTSRGMTSPPCQIVTGHCLSPRQCSLGAAYPITLSAASRPITGWKLRHSPALFCSPVLSSRTPNGVCTQHRADILRGAIPDQSSGQQGAQRQALNGRFTYLYFEQGSVFRC